ncbi:hypothetical protein BDZ97DRAFT_1149934 [Flammula alnicola]|nr:hypothetical protein BDZ97DRAFT_1149934 [Flammula alnicola]
MWVDPGTYGALLLGALVASGLSGVFGVQCLIYFKCYPKDKKGLKGLVLFAWSLELIHTGLVWASIWSYFIKHFGEPHYIDHIQSTIALSVVLTLSQATLTFLAHCLFAHRIYHLSEQNLYLTLPVIVLAFGRLAAASVSGGEMIYLESYALFRKHFLWLFSLGLGLSSAVDILVTLSLFLLLRKSRRESIRLHPLIDALILYTFEIGSLTSIATVISLLCWTVLNNSLVFLGLHFVIGKLYANSLLATLNSRRELRRARSTAFDFVHFNIPPATVSTIQFHWKNAESPMETAVPSAESDSDALKNPMDA